MVVNNITASNSYTSTPRGWGSFQLRYTGVNDISRKITHDAIKESNGLQVIHDQLDFAKQDTGGEIFNIFRLFDNYVGENHASSLNLTSTPVQHQTQTGRVTKYDNSDNISKIREGHEKVKAKSGHLIDQVELGFELLNENNTGWVNGHTDGAHNSTDAQFAYFEMMKAVWGKKLSICIGGSFGDYTNSAGNYVPPQWTHKILKMIVESGFEFLGEFNDSWGQENWDNGFHLPYKIWTDAGVQQLPIIKKREVTGGCNQWLTHPAVHKTPAQLYAEHIEKLYTWMHNMGCWPTYSGTDAFIEACKSFVSEQLALYFSLLGGVQPPILDIPTLLHPENGSVWDAGRIVLHWEPVDNANRYIIGTSKGEIVTLDTKTHLDVEAGEIVWWKVRAKNGENLSEWSENWNFSTRSVVDPPPDEDLLGYLYKTAK
jgi:hypothetical protein